MSIKASILAHEWLNTILLGIVAFFVIATYNQIVSDHERIANHETRITVIESKGKPLAIKIKQNEESN